MRMMLFLSLARASVVGISLASAMGATSIAHAREEIPAETRVMPYSAEVSACHSEGVLARIRSRFAATESRFWNSSAEIVAVDRIRQAGFRPHGLDLIPRRYCEALAIMHDNRRLRLTYAIVEGAGITGMGEGVQFCLEGYDRNHRAMPGCTRLDR